MKGYIKWILIGTLLCTWYFVLSADATFATSEPFYEQSQNYENDDNLNIAGNLTQEELVSDTSTFARIRDFFGMGGYVASSVTSEGKAPAALLYIKMIVNLLLGFVSFISLIMIIAAFYMIFFSKQEESIGKARKMLIWVAIALAVMWLSRYIVSYFFDLYNTATSTL